MLRRFYRVDRLRSLGLAVVAIPEMLRRLYRVDRLRSLGLAVVAILTARSYRLYETECERARGQQSVYCAELGKSPQPLFFHFAQSQLEVFPVIMREKRVLERALENPVSNTGG